MKKKRIAVLLLALMLSGLCGNKAVVLGATNRVEATQEKNDKCQIDYANAASGYVTVKYTQETDKKLKAQVTGPDKVTYTYDIKSGRNEVFPLTSGDGTYTVAVYQNVKGSSYSSVLSAKINVKLKNEFMPFLSSNQYVNYTSKTKVVVKAASLTKGIKDPLEKVKAVYNYVVKNYSYDKEKAKTVQSGYLPNLDDIYKKKKGICFDYAAMMAAMLRSQKIPVKLVIGYAGDVYHAWVSVYTEKDGWVDGVIYFNGETWKLMDPTFASTGNSSKEVMDYIGNGKNYKQKYTY
ncbi:transglutaminase-like domain-containing protein [Acetivibrio ethanolgignens]|uniref:Transglutaminase-like domain-containing protein n=1 Tax=Acetivibrio ethanolgignens TaxID=290052 RepID=A0A0V8QDE3_9FIRM|nr:transglutaminase-like domain-containing protein [Acetivibrio ethanolgignens]KSV58419.1 hypothetical protein ASU35_13120 [Acetivibrio ethanolgignens]